MIRGNRKERIFFKNDHFEIFCGHLERVVSKYNCQIHLYCLMTNHVHLVIEVDNIPLSKIMQSINSIHARIVNDDMNLCGHVFQGRYRAKMVSNDKYLLELCYYIHDNPRKAKMVKDFDDYPCSSHHCYSQNKSLTWLTTKRVEAVLHNYMKSGKDAYQKYIDYRDKNQLESEFCQLDEDGELIIVDSINDRKRDEPYLDLSVFSIKEIIEIVCDYIEVDMTELSSPSLSKKIILARGLVAFYCHYHAYYTLTDISYYFAQKPGGVSRNLHKRIKEDETIKMMEMLRFEFLKRKAIILSR